MRTLAPSVQAVLQQRDYPHHIRVRTANADGVLIDITSWMISGVIEANIDQRVATLSLELVREEGESSFSPMMEDSALNVRGDGTFAPLIDKGRLVVVETAPIDFGAEPASSDWVEFFGGYWDKPEWGGKDPVFRVSARDRAGILLDALIKEEEEYGSADGIPLAVVAQQLLTRWAASEQLQVRGDPGWDIRRFRQERARLLEALYALAQTRGWDTRHLYDETGVSWLTLYDPDREAQSPVWTFGPDDYEVLPEVALDTDLIRNDITIRYTREDGVRDFVHVQDAVSIQRYGGPDQIPFSIIIEESDESPIKTAADALAMGNAMLSDMAYPPVEQSMRAPLFYPVELTDLLGFLPNGVHYDTPQAFGVSGYRHEIRQGHGMTTIQTRGKPAGAYRTWIRRAQRRRERGDFESGVPLEDFRETQSTHEDVLLQWVRPAVFSQVLVYDRLVQFPFTEEPWPQPGDLADHVLDDEDHYFADRPPPGSIRLLLFVGRTADGGLGKAQRHRVYPVGEGPALLLVEVDGQTVKVVGNPAVRSIAAERMDGGGAWEERRDGNRTTFNVPVPAGQWWDVRVTGYDEPVAEVFASTPSDSEDITVFGPGAGPGSGHPQWVKVETAAPPTSGSSLVRITLHADSAGSGHTVQVYARRRTGSAGGWSDLGNITASLMGEPETVPGPNGPPPSSPPTTEQWWDWDAAFPRQSSGTFIEFEIKAEIWDAGNNVVDTRTRYASYYYSVV